LSLAYLSFMKAVAFEKHGGPEVLKYTEVPDPRIKADEVLIEVRACALNHLDVWVRGGMPGIKIPLPHILGNDVAGVVREVGALVTWVTETVDMRSWWPYPALM
jgi:NADPH:quinone reductase-like Zn-dependent oxidoreductase